MLRPSTLRSSLEQSNERSASDKSSSILIGYNELALDGRSIAWHTARTSRRFFCVSSRARYILSTIINNYEPDSTILISTHLISDVENILDEVVFIKNGHIVLKNDVEDIRFNQGKSVDVLFREVFKCLPNC